jgi:hypothetical protein
LKQESISTGSLKEIQALSDEAWLQFFATLPEGIDYVAEASVRGLILGRIRTAMTKSEFDKEVLRKVAPEELFRPRTQKFYCNLARSEP